MKIIAIFAMTESLLIWNSQSLPWNIPEDLKHFQTLTQGWIVIMGKNTYNSLPENYRPLPKRRNIILTRDCTKNLESYTTIENCIDALQREWVCECFVIGGALIYNQFFEKWLIDEVQCTLVYGNYDGDIYIDEWRENFTLSHSQDFSQGKFQTYKKRVQ